MADVWIEKLPKAKRGLHRGKIRYKVRARAFTGVGTKKRSTSRIFTTKSGAAKYKEHLIAGGLVPENMTVADVACRFIKYDCSEKNEESASDYKAIINNHILRHVLNFLHMSNGV